ncbi:MAG: NADPH-dependent oxidoreductase [Anaerolineae bacterium]|jgi:nitroreductase|nr:NADPH-dependent oxidoreductase [Anaerolineae bacterium]MBT3712546.1 NADPH-dependent oxidoreductase [Anaerolineae bacterium]MBT4311367.1 NADPH-dependent oxidoreductase [Anaerolineae bacterium]MBT4459575.1 NADPH-dependent oxidoreductase [Anaerolineae bacterium]MBT4841668.1 NADPH-dependent oxidoreductase [Anaerolineae bacterium]
MDNPTLNLIHAHGSVRRYKPDPVPASAIERIVAAAQRASTSSNMQIYSVIAVTDADKRNQLAELCGGQSQIREAPVFLAWCADRARLDQVCALRGYMQSSETLENFLVAAVDAAIAAQTAALAAESVGLGICYIGAIRNNSTEVIKLLELPKSVFPITGMTVGVPVQAPRIRPRLPQEAILHWESYNPDQDAALLSYDQTMIETGIYKDRQVPIPGKEGQTESYGWMEHTARRVSQKVRPEMRAIIEKQGYGLK